MAVNQIVKAHQDAEFTCETILKFNGGRTRFHFLGTRHDDYVYYYNEEDMELQAFKHRTALYEHNLLYIVKGFIAGKGWEY